MNYLLRKSFAMSAIGVLFASLAAPALAADSASRRKNCPFEKRTVSQVVSATRPSPTVQIAQALPVAQTTPPPPQVTPAEVAPVNPSTDDPAATEGVERVRAIYKVICSRSRQVQTLPPQQPIEQPPAAAPIEAPVRALW